MNMDQPQGQYEQVKGKLKQVWGKLGNEDIALYDGNKDEFFERIHENYGIARQDAEKIIRDLETPDRKTEAA